MRPIFIIYTVAGLTALLAAANAGAYGYHIHAMRFARTALAPDPEQRKRMDDTIDSEISTVVVSSALAITQIGVCFAAWRLKGAARAA